jgi:hypothetical protein
VSLPSPDTLDREKEKLFVTDAELIRRLGVPEKIARQTLRELDRDRTSGFPPKVRIWGDRRHWPTVEAYFRNKYGTKVTASKGSEP